MPVCASSRHSRANPLGDGTGTPQEGCTCFMDGVGTHTVKTAVLFWHKIGHISVVLSCTMSQRKTDKNRKMVPNLTHLCVKATQQF